MPKYYDKTILRKIPIEYREQVQRIIADYNQRIQHRYHVYNKMKERIIFLKQKQKDLEKETGILSQQIGRYNSLLTRKRSLLNRIGSLDASEEFLDSRDEKIRIKEHKIIEKENKLEERKELLELKGKKVAELREMQSTSFFNPTLAEERLFCEERRTLLEGVQQYGTVNRALKKLPELKTKQTTIKYYEKKYPEFAMDLLMSYEMWKDGLDSEVIDRAMEGTDKPVFQKGEYLGDYKFKSDKLLELAAKAHLPEKYDRGKIDRIDGGQAPVNFNIINFNTANEEDVGCVRDIGVVKSVDRHGKIERVTRDGNIAANEESITPNTDYIDMEQEGNIIDV